MIKTEDDEILNAFKEGLSELNLAGQEKIKSRPVQDCNGVVV